MSRFQELTRRAALRALGERRLPACNCRQLAGNILASAIVVISDPAPASCRDYRLAAYAPQNQNRSPRGKC